jgi:hypothetical protein
MWLKGVTAFTMIATAWLGVQADAQTPCPELLRLRNAATEAWRQAMRAPPSERCGALHRASLAAEATLTYADSNRESCHFGPIVEPSGRIPPRGGAGARHCLCWAPASTVSGRYHPTLSS